MADFLKEAIEDFEEYYDIELVSGLAKGYFKKSYEMIKRVNLIDDYYAVLKEKRDMFITQPFTKVKKLLEDEKELLEEQKKNENMMAFATVLLLGVTIILAFETVATFFLSKFSIVSTDVVMLVLIFIVLLHYNKKRKVS